MTLSEGGKAHSNEAQPASSRAGSREKLSCSECLSAVVHGWRKRQRAPTLRYQRRLLIVIFLLFAVGLGLRAWWMPAPPQQLDLAVDRLNNAAKRLSEVSLDLDRAPVNQSRINVDSALEALRTAEQNLKGSNEEVAAALLISADKLAKAREHVEENVPNALTSARSNTLKAQQYVDTAYSAVLAERRALARQRNALTAPRHRVARDLQGVLTWFGPYGSIAVGTLFILFWMIPPGHLLRPLSIVSWRLRGLNVAGLRFDVDAEAIRSDKTEIEYALNIIAAQYRSHYHAARRKFGVQESMCALVRDFVEEIETNALDERQKFSIKSAREGDFRATLHVPFYIDTHEVIQLTEYVGPNGDVRGSTGSAGRVFSQRYGIIGRACREGPPNRSGMPRYDPHVPGPRALEQEYGMTKDESTRAASGRATFFATPIRNSCDEILGVFYVDMVPCYGLGSIAAATDAERDKTTDNLDSIDHPNNVRYAERLAMALTEAPSYGNLVAQLEKVRDEVGWDKSQVIQPTRHSG